jgi:hypothetical protein
MLSVILLSVILLSVILLIVIMLYVIMLNVNISFVIKLTVVAPCTFLIFYSQYKLD